MLERLHPILLVGIGGFFGAISRYQVAGWLKDFKPIPYGTLAVNVLGSFLLGALVVTYQLGALDTVWVQLIGIGFLGSFTTMSSFVVETVNLNDEAHNLALLNLLVMLICVFIGAYLGRVLAFNYLGRVSA